jgi:hypothetical protein
MPNECHSNAIVANDRQVVLRVPTDSVDRAERLRKKLAERPEYAGVRLTWTTVLRLALLRGLDVLEAENTKGRVR